MSQNHCEIIITGFNPYVKTNHFQLFFEKYGKIKSINIQTDFEKAPFANILFSSKEEAQNAIKHANNLSFYGRKIKVSQDKSNHIIKKVKQSSSFLRLMIYSCPPVIDNEQDLKIFASPYIIQSPVYFCINEDHNKFVIFNLCVKEDINSFILSKNGEIFRGYQIFVGNSIYKIPPILTFTGFPENSNYMDSFTFFSKFGELSESDFSYNNKRYIIFKSLLSSQNCWNTFQNEKQSYQNNLISISVPDEIPDILKNHIARLPSESFNIDQ